MTQIRFGRLIVLACMGLAVACTSGTDGGTSGNTELNLDIINPGATSGELGFSIDRVDYRITCAGNPPGSYPIPDADTIGTLDDYDDSVDISGAFETVDTRVPPVWQAVMDLPPGLCTITLSVWDGNEVVCIGSQTLTINEDATTKYDIVLVCSLSIDLPDGMADVDGEFFFITGNLCPKLYVLNAIPSTAVQQTSGPLVGQAVTEVQYRAKDPDNTCGNNCDPQSCTFDNPPVCTPAPYNPNDPLCNPAAGGDPNSAPCQDGVSATGLVCTIVAVPLATGNPGGTFLSPLDGVTPIGPVLPVNLNTISGTPGIILPGLGGPVGTTSSPSGGAPGDNPLYPGLPNADGSLPPLIYQCDRSIPGSVFFNLTCSDGDLECDQQKITRVSCSIGDFCFVLPVDCSGAGDCFSDGVCDNFCDPIAVPPCDRCPGQNVLLPEGTLCADGGPNDVVCDGAGTCVECVTSNTTQCDVLFPPGDCVEPPTCVSNTCVPGGTSPDGTPCSTGQCVGGSCTFNPDPPCLIQPSLCQKVITVSCGNNVTSDVSILPYFLTVEPTAIVANQPFTADIGGVAQFSETFLDAAQGAVPGGVTKASLVDLIATVQTRGGGATGADVPMSAGAPIPYECVLDDSGPGAQTPCDPANDVASVPGVRGNTDCVPTGSFNPCGRIVQVPTSSDCAPAGVCDTLGKLSQCVANGFCATAGLPLPLDDVIGAAYTAGDGVTPGQTTALFGWADNPAPATAVGAPAIDGDGTWNMLQPSYTGVAGEVGLAVNAGGLAVQLECVMGVDSGGPDGVGVPDDGSPTPDSALLAFPVLVP
jgi:hypothetical protein